MNTKTTVDELISVPDAAKSYKGKEVTAQYLYNLIALGKLRHLVIGKTKFVYKKDIE